MTATPTPFPGRDTLDQYALSRIQEDVSETSRDRVKSAIEGLIVPLLHEPDSDEDERAAGYKAMAQKLWAALHVQNRQRKGEARIGPARPLPKPTANPARMLDPKEEILPAEGRAPCCEHAA